MTTAEKAITATFNEMTLAQQGRVLESLKKLFEKKKRVSEREYFKPLSEGKFLEKMARAEEDYKTGRVLSREDFEKRSREKYGI